MLVSREIFSQMVNESIKKRSENPNDDVVNLVEGVMLDVLNRWEIRLNTSDFSTISFQVVYSVLSAE